MAAITTSHPMPKAALGDLHERYARNHRRADLTRLVKEYGSYANGLARRMHRGGEPLEDLEQVAAEGLVLALGRFDPDRGVPFAAFAKPTILGSLKRHFRDLGWAVRVPRQVHDLAGPFREARDHLAGQLGRQPTIAELATQLGVPEASLDAVAQATRARTTSSLEAPLGDDGGTLGDHIGSDDRSLALAEDRIALHRALDDLDERDREVLGRYFFEE